MNWKLSQAINSKTFAFLSESLNVEEKYQFKKAIYQEKMFSEMIYFINLDFFRHGRWSVRQALTSLDQEANQHVLLQQLKANKDHNKNIESFNNEGQSIWMNIQSHYSPSKGSNLCELTSATAN